MAKGGKREGAGRKKAQHTIQAEAFKAYLIREVIKEKEPIVRALIDGAKAGNPKLIAEVLDRILGRAITPISGVDPEGNLLPFQIVIKQKEQPIDAGDTAI